MTDTPMVWAYEDGDPNRPVYRPMNDAEYADWQALQAAAAAAASAPPPPPCPGTVVTQQDGTPAIVTANDPAAGTVTIAPLAAPVTVPAANVTPTS